MGKLIQRPPPVPLPAVRCSQPGCEDPAVCRPAPSVRSRQAPDRQHNPEGAFHLAVPGKENYIVQYGIQLQLCHHHRDTFRLKHVLNEATWSAIENQLRQSGFVPPDKDTYELEWEDATDVTGKTIIEA